MTPSASASQHRKGHPTGGLLVLALGLITAAVSEACGPGRTSAEALAAPAPAGPTVYDPLAVYRELGFLVGRSTFPIVGRFVYLAGPGDSTYAILALSLPNTALRFRREETGFLARYRVAVAVGDSAAPIATFDEAEDVRVRTFRETSRAEESVVFQGFLTLPHGEYPARVEVEDLGSTRQLVVDTRLHVPDFQGPWTAAPILTYRAEPRTDRASRPSLIVNPRATVQPDGPPPGLYLETAAAADSLSTQVTVPGEGSLWSREVATPGHVGGLRSAKVDIPTEELPPGVLAVSSGPDLAAGSSSIVVTPLADWTFASYGELLDYLRYAGTSDQLGRLRDAPLADRAERFRTFWEARDPDPETPENEFFRDYFRRIQEANDRFGGLHPGWLTDPGAVYITFGPPDEVFRQLDPDPRTGVGRSQVWRYERSLGFDLRLTFVDETGTGEFRLTAESRRAFETAMQRLYSQTSPPLSPGAL